MDLDELDRLEREASPRPWSSEPCTFDERGSVLYSGRSDTEHGFNLGTLSDQDRHGAANVAAIVALRNAAPELIAAAQRLFQIKEAMERQGYFWEEREPGRLTIYPRLASSKTRTWDRP